MKHGVGTLSFVDNSYYTGQFAENEIQGKGVYKWNDGRVYEGMWNASKMHGLGKLTWPDGRYYEGEYVDDQKEGRGVFVWADGRKYDGLWKGGKQHGRGQYTSEGKTQTGEWNDGKRINWIQ